MPNNIFYVHVPSCGGTTFWSILESVYGNDQVRRNVRNELDQTNFIDAVTNRTLPTTRVMGGHVHFSVAAQLFADRQFITLLRHPIDRAVSVYARKVRNGKWHAKIESGERDLLDFWSQEARELQLKRYFCNDRDVPLSVNSKVTSIPNASTDDILEVLSNQFAFVGFLEYYHQSLFMLANTLGWKNVPTYDQRNIGGNKPTRIGSDTIAELEGLFESDCTVYKHMLERFQQKWLTLSTKVHDELSQFEIDQSARTHDLLMAHDGDHPNTKYIRC